MALRSHATLDASEPLRRGNHSHVMSTPQAMASRFADHPEAVRETLRLAERLRFDLTRDLGYRYPGAEEGDASSRLAELCRTRLEERYGPGGADPAVVSGVMPRAVKAKADPSVIRPRRTPSGCDWPMR